jgi:Transposase DDE domain
VLSADHSCRAAVARLIAHRLSQGKRPCSAETGAYCQARQRLPEEFFSNVARRTGSALESNVDSQWLWKGRRVYIYDGSTVTMPDTPENQRAYPQNVVQQPGLGFPIARIAAVFSLACGAVLRYNQMSWISSYRTRWNAELDLRSLKQTLQMDVLRCKTPELVRKEIWTHILAYNLIRTIMAQAATKHGIEPRSISFKGAVQTLEAFQPAIALRGHRDSTLRRRLYQQLLDALAVHRVADRLDRYEPRRLKRRKKRYDFLMKPRWMAKRDILKGVTEN